MWDVLWRIWLYAGYFLTVAASGFFLYRLCVPFVRPRRGRFWKALLFLTLAGTSGMVIWIGDPNLLYTLPVFFARFFLSTGGTEERGSLRQNFMENPVLHLFCER